MRKFRVAAIILVALVMILTSCSQDAAAGLGKVMKWMSGNIYGIKPDLRRPDAAIKLVDNISASKESMLDPQLTADLIEALAGFSGSTQSVDSFISNLDAAVSTPIPVFREAVEEMKATAESISSNEVPANDLHVARLVSMFNEAIVSFEGFSSEVFGERVLTRRDIVTLSLMNSLIQKISDSVENKTYESDEKLLAADANEVLTVLKITTNYSNLNVIGDIDITGLLSAFSEEKSLERSSATNTIVLILGKTLGKLASFVTEGYGFSHVKYYGLHMESKSIRFCYEMAMIPYIKSSGEESVFSKIFESEIDYGMTMDDLVMYLASSFSRVMDSEKVSDLWILFLSKYLNEKNIEALCDMKNKSQNLQNPIEIMKDVEFFYDNVADALGIEAEDEKTPGEVLKSKIEIVYDFAKKSGAGEKTSFFDLVRALREVDEEEMPDEEVKAYISDLVLNAISDALGKFDDVKSNTIYLVGTCLGILADAGFDTLFHSIFGVVL